MCIDSLDVIAGRLTFDVGGDQISRGVYEKKLHVPEIKIGVWQRSCRNHLSIKAVTNNQSMADYYNFCVQQLVSTS